MFKNPIMSNMWGVLYCKDDYTDVYFVRCDKNSSPLKFDKSFFSFDGRSEDLIIFHHIYIIVFQKQVVEESH